MVKAFLGTGLLGAAFVRAMLNRGDEVHVWNRTNAKAKALEADGAQSYGTAAEAVAGVGWIHVALKDDESVNEVLASIQDNLQQGTIIIDHTTTSIEGAVQRTDHFKERGIMYLHAPVFMNPDEAIKQTGTMLISGDPDIVKTVAPELQKMTGKLINLGDTPGKSSGMKLLGNLFWLSFSATLHDMMAFSNAINFSMDDIKTIFKIWDMTSLTDFRLDSLAERKNVGYKDPLWNLEMARKDARLMIEASKKEENNALLVIPAVAKAMDQRLVMGMKADDWEVVFEETIKRLKAGEKK